MESIRQHSLRIDEVLAQGDTSRRILMLGLLWVFSLTTAIVGVLIPPITLSQLALWYGVLPITMIATVLYLLGQTRAVELVFNLTCITIFFLVFASRYNALFIFVLAQVLLLVNGFRAAVHYAALLLILAFIALFTPVTNLFWMPIEGAERGRFMLTLMLTLSTTLALQRWVTRAREALRAFYTVQAGRLAETDGLTGSHNLTGLRLELGRYIDAQRPFALLKVSVRNLEVIGDIYGNAFSERALVEFSTHIENVARQFCGEGSRDALVARDHSGEFYVLLDTAAVGSAGEWFSRALVNSVSDEFRISGMAYPLVIAVGLTKYPTDALSAEELLVNASESSQLASSRGPNVVEIFSTQVERQIASRKAVEEGLTESLEAGQFELNFMPIVSCGSRSVSGCEVLLRCTHPKLAGVSPEVFITLAERTRLILRIDEWVIDHALEALAAMIAEGYGGSMAVNISALELQNGAFPELVEALLLKHGVEAHRLELELTETALVNNDEQGVAMLARLKRIGVVLSLDDFGTGYTAFSQLMHYPVDSLKIDKSFVTGLRSLDSAQGRLIKVILGLAEIYALKVTVEGIETDEEAALLKSMGCQLGQGYLFSKPVPLEQFRAMVLA